MSKEITIYIKGGMVQKVEGVPEDMSYIVRDYDVDGIHDEDLWIDENDEKFWEY